MNEKSGRIVVFGDSSCIDGANHESNSDCLWLLKDILLYTSEGNLSNIFESHKPILSDFISKRMQLPFPIEGNQLSKYSNVKKGNNL